MRILHPAGHYPTVSECSAISNTGIRITTNPVWTRTNNENTLESRICDECYYQHRLLALLKAGKLD